MRFDIIGLGRMGSNFALHAAEKGHDVIVFDRGEDARERTAAAGVDTTSSLEEVNLGAGAAALFPREQQHPVPWREGG